MRLSIIADSVACPVLLVPVAYTIVKIRSWLHESRIINAERYRELDTTSQMKHLSEPVSSH
jgi:hypothetical protein